jgi:hypothetical protein
VKQICVKGKIGRRGILGWSASGDRPEIWGIMTIRIGPAGYVAGWDSRMERTLRLVGTGIEGQPRSVDVMGCLEGTGTDSVSVCRRQALRFSVTRRFRRRARIEMKAIEMNAMRWSFERSKIVFNRR